ncbi:SAM-dependent methyltransferase [Bacillus velezensis]|uniref:HsdM family class I SAM-dependent methyltransferase n=1 Tax=Bacillus amyloliquefaciens group TaxID=1938374 RepID=UPI0003973630|nr:MULTISPECIES: N-6 DNA methylase [Bacillus amyloliquefaciens group]ERH51137.1 adenine methyltransferase [Bacillus amyloliquefaciens EGD-AQ14]POI17754.1 adenine methyltransferase [Bacillus velezensis]QZY42165.1 SAM-dependent methyltransferase [Bacillus velezensis]WRT06161.1 N-6 DNA methylase [Bacillus velezensis]
MPNERTSTDQLVRRFIEELGVPYEEQTSSNVQIREALKNASKSRDSRGIGKPEFIFFSGNHLFIIEDKLTTDKLEYKDEGGNIDTEFPYRRDYAVNGAIHYAKHVIEKTNSYKEVIAIGIAGDSLNYEIHPYFVSETEVKALPDMKSLEDISPENVEEFFNVAVKGELPKEERELREVNKIAADMHEDLRNYGQLEGEKKATVVSAILLALEEPTFSLDQLQGSDREGSADGQIIFTAVQRFLQNVGIVPYAKVGEMLDQFTFIQRDVTLNTKNANLEMTPLKYFATTLEAKIMDKIKSNTDFDILGNFYGEFVKYGGNDGNSLGIVLTPRHITSLMVELIQINKSDYVLDPACGTGAFLISAMNRMLGQVETDEEITDIKQNRLYGIEIQQKLFTIATTNMILRGDGKSNLIRDNSLTVDKEEMKGHGINKILMNPPYSQAKNDQTQHLSELNFIQRALDMLVVGGKLCVIVPQSTMVGKTRHDKARKKQILEKHTLESVITLNTDTFHGVGVNPCIAVFTAGFKHPENKRVSFVNFLDDGYVVRKHVGLVGDGTEKGKREHLLNVLEGNEEDGTNFIVKTTIESTDEWLHSFYYFNEEIPSESEFEKSIADFMSFKLDMISHGKGYLFEDGGRDGNE